MVFDLNYSNCDGFLGDVNKVTDRYDVINFIEVLENYDPIIRDYYLNLANHLGFSDLKPYHLFYIKAGNRSVCIASLFFHNEMCGIFDVLTHDEFRKQGYASIMMHFLLNYAKNISLTASSKEAVSIYKNLGFQELGNYHCYEYKK
ncbi:GNAT family N-acetyltransferase [Silvanigrella paludirubra]|uniref:GNAT family N-acetyltransferase n=1 Tax=Silvanigrella paludirubra TaxID=2499159 RepID=A0A6N6VWM0_9BACT|nr:GNAT family N-acetyltransferase [Silvanigrella paludirubra]KAB8038863.1 GNAT family N-acetyltransferase [Silvanigrella paludirubra]